MLTATIALTTVADIVAAPAAGHSIRLWYVQFASDGTGAGTIHAGAAAATTRIAHANMVAGSNVVLDFSGIGGYTLPAATALQGTMSANAMKGVAFYTVT